MKRKISVDTERLLGLFSRYIVIFLLGFGGLFLFYFVLTPLTVGVLSFVLSFFGSVAVDGTFIFWGSVVLSIVPACVAGAAFYLLFFLVFSTPCISLSRRFVMLGLGFLLLFLLNMFRMLFLVALIGVDQSFFVVVHWLLWHVVSTLFVVGIWLFLVRLFRVGAVPVVDDLKYLVSLVEARRSH